MFVLEFVIDFILLLYSYRFVIDIIYRLEL